jgi:hypothetical protein
MSGICKYKNSGQSSFFGKMVALFFSLSQKHFVLLDSEMSNKASSRNNYINLDK